MGDEEDYDDIAGPKRDHALPIKKRGRPKKILTDADIEEATRAALGTVPVIEITPVPRKEEKQQGVKKMTRLSPRMWRSQKRKTRLQQLLQMGITVKMKPSQKVQMRSRQPRSLKPSDLSLSTRAWRRKLKRQQKLRLVVVGKTAILWMMELKILLVKMTTPAILLMTILSTQR